MARRAKWWFGKPAPFPRLWQRHAFLLVEATLTAIVIAGGLVFISRGIAGSLKALSTIQQYDRLLQLAESTFNELETQAQQFHISLPREGTYDPPNSGYRWKLAGRPFEGGPDDLAGTFQVITLTVSRGDTNVPLMCFTTLWPTEWIGP